MYSVIEMSGEDSDAIRKARLIIVDKDWAASRELRDSLTLMGHEVLDLAVSPEQAIEMAGRHRPDLVLMDVGLRGPMDGIEAARILRRRFNIPVVYVTARSERDVVEKAVASAPFGYLLKPFDPSDVRITLELALFRHFLEAQALRQKRLVELILGTVTEGLIATDASLRVTYFNREAERITGKTARSVLGKPLVEVFPVETEEVLDGEAEGWPLGSHALPSSTSACSVMVVARDHRRVPIELSVSALRDESGAVLGGVFAFWEMASEDSAPRL